MASKLSIAIFVEFAKSDGFKLFFEEDGEFGPLMTPAQVLALKPTVDYVLYE